MTFSNLMSHCTCTTIPTFVDIWLNLFADSMTSGGWQIQEMLLYLSISKVIHTLSIIGTESLLLLKAYNRWDKEAFFCLNILKEMFMLIMHRHNIFKGIIFQVVVIQLYTWENWMLTLLARHGFLLFHFVPTEYCVFLLDPWGHFFSFYTLVHW